MKKFILPVLIILLAASCSTVKVTSDFEKGAPFASYKTYAFTPEAMNLNIQDINRRRLITAVEHELSLKGFTKADNPDVLIDLKVTGEKKQTATATNMGRYGFRYGWGGATTTINYDSYLEGTVFINMIDSNEKEVVWQGRGVGTVDPNASAEKKEKKINSGVQKIFTTYPPKTK